MADLVILVCLSDLSQVSVLGPLLFIISTVDMWNGMSSKMTAYDGDKSL